MAAVAGDRRENQDAVIIDDRQHGARENRTRNKPTQTGETRCIDRTVSTGA